MLSQKRRIERYRIIYMWKILEDLAPNCGVEETALNERLGRRVKIPNQVPGGCHGAQTLREQSFQIHDFFNCLSKNIRNLKFHPDEFRETLDKYLGQIPNQPKGQQYGPDMLTQSDREIVKFTSCMDPGDLDCKKNIYI